MRLDSPALRILAGYTRAEAEYDVPDLLPVVLDELNLVFYPRDSEAGQDPAVRALAHHMLAGRLTPQELAMRIHQRFGHQLPLAEHFAELDDEYEIIEYGKRPRRAVASQSNLRQLDRVPTTTQSA